MEIFVDDVLFFGVKLVVVDELKYCLFYVSEEFMEVFYIFGMGRFYV